MILKEAPGDQNIHNVVWPTKPYSDIFLDADAVSGICV